MEPEKTVVVLRGGGGQLFASFFQECLRPGDAGPILQVLHERDVGEFGKILRQVSQGGRRRRERDLSHIRGYLTDDGAKQRRFSHAVSAHQTDADAGVNLPAQTVEQFSPAAERKRKVLNSDHELLFKVGEASFKMN